MQSAPTSIIGLPAQNFQSIFGLHRSMQRKRVQQFYVAPIAVPWVYHGNQDDKGDQQLALLAPFGETLNIIPGCCAGFMADVPEW